MRSGTSRRGVTVLTKLIKMTLAAAKLPGQHLDGRKLNQTPPRIVEAINFVRSEMLKGYAEVEEGIAQADPGELSEDDILFLRSTYPAPEDTNRLADMLISDPRLLAMSMTITHQIRPFDWSREEKGLLEQLSAVLAGGHRVPGNNTVN